MRFLKRFFTFWLFSLIFLLFFFVCVEAPCAARLAGIVTKRGLVARQLSRSSARSELSTELGLGRHLSPLLALLAGWKFGSKSVDFQWEMEWLAPQLEWLSGSGCGTAAVADQLEDCAPLVWTCSRR